MTSTNPNEASKSVSEEITDILYANGHSVYHPVLVQQLTKYVDDKFSKAAEEQQALNVAKSVTLESVRSQMLSELQAAVKERDLDAVSTLSAAIQRIY